MNTAPNFSSFSTTDNPPSGPISGAGNAGRPPQGTVDDLFLQLKEASWKGVAFPFSETELDIRHDLVIHRFANRNGAYVEWTGRHPVQITGEIPFLNHIYSAPTETWPQGALYPYQWRLFIKACLDGTSGTFQHPELGPLNCKLDMTNTRWRGSVRGGVIVRAVWIESDDTQADQLGADLSQASPIGNLVANADDLDANIATLEAAVAAQQNPLPPLEFSFDMLANAIVGVFDTTTVLSKIAQGRVDNVIYQSNRVIDSVSRSPILGPLAWPLIQNAERLKDAAYNLKSQPAITTKGIRTKSLAKDSTASEAALFVGSDLTDFIALNYQLIGRPVIPRGTPVNYYAQAA